MQVTWLDKYWITADFAWIDFNQSVKRALADPEKDYIVERISRLTLWGATLYVVIEGWRKWKFSNVVVDEMIEDPKAEMLRQFRNKIFHAETGVIHPFVQDFVDTPDSFRWSYNLHRAFGIYFNRQYVDAANARDGGGHTLRGAITDQMILGMDPRTDPELPVMFEGNELGDRYPLDWPWGKGSAWETPYKR